MHNKVLDFIIQNWYWLLLAGFLVSKHNTLYRSLFLEPIRGGNGVTQADELSKWVLCAILVFMAVVEAQPGEQFASEIFLFIAGSVATLAGIRHYFKPKSGHDKPVE